MSQATIYGLIDPRTHQLRYVGKTSHPLDLRLRQHVQLSRKSRTSHLLKWLSKLDADGLAPSIFPIEEVPDKDWEGAEEFWIAYYKSIGCDLTNGTPGGYWHPGWKHNPEIVTARSRTIRESWEDPERRNLQRQRFLERMNTAEVIAKRKAALSEQRSNPAYRAAQSERLKNRVGWSEVISKFWAGRKRSPEQIAQMRLARLGKKRSPESVAKSIAGLKGQKRTPEQKERIRLGCLEREARKRLNKTRGLKDPDVEVVRRTRY